MTKILLHRYVVVVTACTLLLFGFFALVEFPNVGLKAVAIVLLPTLFVQVMLGVFTYMSIPLTGDRRARGAIAAPIAPLPASGIQVVL